MVNRGVSVVQPRRPTKTQGTAFFVLVVALLTPRAFTQTTAAPAEQSSAGQSPTIVTNADEVTLDMVVRGKGNKPVLDLKPGDITVTDNGAKVTLSDLRLVTGKSSGGHWVTLVFDRLEPSAAKNARDITAKILKAVPQAGFSFAVLNVEGRLRLFQAFTSDRAAVEKAVGAASERDDATKQDIAALPEKNLIALAQTGMNPSGARVSAEERNVAQVTLAALEESQRIVQDQHAPPSLAGLLALAKGQRQIAGRKVIIYFAQGMQVDSSANDVLRSIIGAANRAGVSIYAIDANAIDPQVGGGLMATNAIGNAITYNAQNPPPTGPAAQQSVPFGPGLYSQMSDQLNRIETEGLAGTGDPLAELAAGTGGAYIGGSDSLKKPLQRMVEDMTTYYEASYVPAIEKYDGQFRAVAIKPLRKGLQIRSRAGYFALPPGVGSGMRPFEAPLIKALDEPQLPTDLKFRSAVLRLGDLPDGNASALVVEVPISQLELHQDHNTGLFSMHLAIVAQIKDKAGTVIEHFSEDIPRHGALETIESVRSEVVTLQRHFVAAPGQYVLEAAILDRLNGKIGAQRIDFAISNPSSGASLSDLALVRRTDPISADTDLLEPLRYENGRVVPNLSGEISPEAKNISLFFVVHPDPKVSEPPRLEMEVLRNGEPVGQTPLQLRKNSDGGPMPYMASIKAGAFAPGDYQAIASITQGGKTTESGVAFRVEGPGLASAGTPTGPDVPQPGNDIGVSVPAPQLQAAGIATRESGKVVIAALSEVAAPPPAPEELQGMVENARSRALKYSASLPNFICVEVTDRSVDAAGNGKWRRRDSIAELLRYHDNAETRTILEINGKPSNSKREDLKGTLSLGEFGGVLSGVFQDSSKADFQWKETDALGGGTVQVLSYRVSRENSSWGLTDDNNLKIYPGFHGLVYIDSATKGIRRITLEADDLPRDFMIHSASMVVDYDYIAIGSHDYLMPIRGTVSMKEGKREAVLNEMEFRNYRRYGSKTKILYGGQVVR
ncbi:MAG: VWA domain-containing protein [Candidatus Sulfotelmatobacter sp.]|jgi:VWFA-related protein